MWTHKLPRCILYNCSRLYDRCISRVMHKLHLLKLGDASAGGWPCSSICGLCLEVGRNLDLPPAAARGTALNNGPQQWSMAHWHQHACACPQSDGSIRQLPSDCNSQAAGQMVDGSVHIRDLPVAIVQQLLLVVQQLLQHSKHRQSKSLPAMKQADAVILMAALPLQWAVCMTLGVVQLWSLVTPRVSRWHTRNWGPPPRRPLGTPPGRSLRDMTSG